MKESDTFRRNAVNCMQMAESARDEASFKRFKRMEAAWLALAEEQDWLDGQMPAHQWKMQGAGLNENSSGTR